MRVYDRYVQGAHAIMIAVDLSRLDTFENLPSWLEIAQQADRQPLLALVGTENDLEREIDKDLLDEWVREKGVFYFIETSALTGENVNELFERLSSDLITRWVNSSATAI